MTTPRSATVEFRSAELRPVAVNAELNLEPLYFNDEGPVTFLALHQALGEITDAVGGIETMLEAVPDQADIDPQRFMIRLALERLQSVLARLRPDRSRSNQSYVHDRSTNPPSLQLYEEHLEKCRQRARKETTVTTPGGVAQPFTADNPVKRGEGGDSVRTRLSRLNIIAARRRMAPPGR